MEVYFTDKTPPELFQQIKVDVRDSAVMLSHRGTSEQFFLVTESIPSLIEAIEQAKG